MTARRFLKMLLTVALAALAIDLLIGFGAYRLMGTARSGDSQRAYHINKRTEADVLIFGSSRALHHYDPAVLEKHWGTTVYNAGNDGCGILLNYMQLSSILQRYTPKTVIMDLYGPYDFLREADYSRYLGWARIFYGKGCEALDSVIDDADPTERFKNLSGAYRYNYRIVQVIFDNIASRTTDYHGYRGEEGELDPKAATDLTWPSTELDPLKLEYLRRLAERCRERGVKLYVVVSPYYSTFPSEQIPERVRSILATYGVEPIDMSRDPRFLGQHRYFYDTNHLNSRGARLFTGIVAEKIDSLQKTENQRDKK